MAMLELPPSPLVTVRLQFTMYVPVTGATVTGTVIVVAETTVIVPRVISDELATSLVAELKPLPVIVNVAALAPAKKPVGDAVAWVTPLTVNEPVP
jgi:hypothetical protein